MRAGPGCSDLHVQKAPLEIQWHCSPRQHGRIEAGLPPHGILPSRPRSSLRRWRPWPGLAGLEHVAVRMGHVACEVEKKDDHCPDGNKSATMS